jgi:hypothetical protein
MRQPRIALPTSSLKWKAIGAAVFSRLLRVVDQAGDVDDDHGLISDDPRVVSWSNDADVARAELDFGTVIHLDVDLDILSLDKIRSLC